MYFDIEYSREANPTLDGNTVVDAVVDMVKRLFRWGYGWAGWARVSLGKMLGLSVVNTRCGCEDVGYQVVLGLLITLTLQ